MLCEYAFQLSCRCPVNPKVPDDYTVKVTLPRMMPVESILAIAETFRNAVIFQEELTAALAKKLRATVETTGQHSGVKTRCVCQ